MRNLVACDQAVRFSKVVKLVAKAWGCGQTGVSTEVNHGHQENKDKTAT